MGDDYVSLQSSPPADANEALGHAGTGSMDTPSPPPRRLRSGHVIHKPSQSRGWYASWCLSALFMLFATAGLLSLLFLVKRSMFDGPAIKPPAGGLEPVSFRRHSLDYVLDKDWDFNAPPTVREYHWTVHDIVANPDGVFRPMIVINGKFPGEMIRCNEGDTIVVNIDNQSANATSFHWHGIFQNGSNWMDGTPGVTQCPIASGSKFRYEFTVKGQAGTYFYHGHQAVQAQDGLVGPLIVHSRDEATNQQIPYASDRVVMLQDWYHDLSSGLLKEKLSPGSEASPIPNGALVNGVNVVDCSLHPHRHCDNSTAVLPTFALAPNDNHRLRILNVGAFAWFEVTVDDHFTLPLTEMDGVNIEPAPERNLLLAPGQRYSVVLASNQTGNDAFWMRTRMMTHCFSENVLPDQGVATANAIIRYTEDASSEGTAESPLPTTEDTSGVFTTECKDMVTHQYAPVPKRPAPEYADHSWYLRVNLEIGDWRLERGFLNTSSFRANLKEPTLHRVMDGLGAKNQSFRQQGVNSKAFDLRTELVISQTDVEVVDFMLQNFDEGNHPFHLHGHQMFILAAGHGYFPGYESLGLAPEGKGLLDASNRKTIDNPVRRDVTTVEGFGWKLIRVVFDNPGLWLFHCHMAWHGESGMAMQIASRLDALETLDIPRQNRALCEKPVEELRKGAPPPDSTWFGRGEVR